MYTVLFGFENVNKMIGYPVTKMNLIPFQILNHHLLKNYTELISLKLIYAEIYSAKMNQNNKELLK